MKTKFIIFILLYGFVVKLNAQIPTDGLVGYWPFNGNANDESGNGLHGVANNPELSSDRFGQDYSAYSFFEDEISVSDNDLLDFTDSFSLCLWYKSDNIEAYLGQVLLGKLRDENGGRYSLQLYNPGDLYETTPEVPKLILGINTGPTGANCIYQSQDLISGWHFLVATYDSNALKLYFDGELIDEVSSSLVLPVDNTPLLIGRGSANVDASTPDGSTVRYFFGQLDDIRIYDRALAPDEILTLYYEPNCSDTIVNDTTTYFVSSPGFESSIQVIYFDSTEMQSTNIGECDSLINHYSRYVFDATYFTDTIQINDTIKTAVYDTTFVTIRDTIITKIVDTTFVTIYDSIAISDTLIIDIKFTGLNTSESLNTIKVYPNPAKDKIFIHSGEEYEQLNDYTIKILNISGDIIFHSDITNQLFDIDIGEFGGTGLYFILITDDNDEVIEIRKILLQ
ncbi:LamG-like jellyroll fold domain-containing protein [Marinoscillum sp. MHG1-6]|uniref:LamG-like jellyroll fold domain-containing protein n=1 Tax=Marinoscillum sp. MHG1-6 TaxID=2959627 RepID=UPI00215709FE|nr:LamG-like jellyroll fold domain-containing protein [Marinoscillum sp. MHG1-6]